MEFITTTLRPLQSHAVGSSSAAFEAKIQPALAEDLGSTNLGVSQLSVYFRTLTMLHIVQTVIENEEGEGATEIALGVLRDEFEGSIEASGETVN